MFCSPGLVYDITGDFNNSFYLGAACGFLGGCFSLLSAIRLHCCENNSNSKSRNADAKQYESVELNVTIDGIGSIDDTGSQTVIKQE